MSDINNFYDITSKKRQLNEGIYEYSSRLSVIYLKEAIYESSLNASEREKILKQNQYKEGLRKDYGTHQAEQIINDIGGFIL